MPFSYIATIHRNKFIGEILNILLFAGLSLIFGLISEVNGGISNFREIPLLIYVFYSRTPWLLPVAALLAAIPTSPEAHYFENFIIHFPALIEAWILYYLIHRSEPNYFAKGVLWFLATITYYSFFLIPTWSLVSDAFADLRFWDKYRMGIQSVTFEMIATAFITSLYLIQYEIRNNLENLVEKRTEELAVANTKLQSVNEELLASSEQIKMINKNLDGLVKQRAEKIQEQVQLLNKYANMNSHEVRAPLARMLGLLQLIKKEKETSAKDDLLDRLYMCSQELDDIVRQMNRLLEKQIVNNDFEE